MNLHLRELRYRPVEPDQADKFPFNVPAIQTLDILPFQAPVTFLVGENGSGKSTFLEALALNIGAYSVGSADLGRDETLTAVHALADRLQLIWRIRIRDGFFLRAEDFFGYVKRLAQMEAELLADLQQIDQEYKGRTEKARGLARMAHVRELHALREQYGRNLNTISHGESFLELFQSRLKPGGLYLLDEPETPLSPMRQLTLLSMIKQMVEMECQFIIATHSPILMAYPGASILSFDYQPIQEVDYAELEHVTVTRSFLNDPEQFLRHL